MEPYRNTYSITNLLGETRLIHSTTFEQAEKDYAESLDNEMVFQSEKQKEKSKTIKSIVVEVSNNPVFWTAKEVEGFGSVIEMQKDELVSENKSSDLDYSLLINLSEEILRVSNLIKYSKDKSEITLALLNLVGHGKELTVISNNFLEQGNLLC